MSYSLIFLSPKHLVSPLELISIQSDDEKRKPMYIHPSNLQGPSKALFFSPASGTSDCSPEDIKMLQLFEISGMLMALPIKIHSEENSRQEDSRNQELGEAPRIETETLAEALKKEVPAMEKPIDKPEPSPEEKVQAQVPRSPKKALPSTRAKQSYEGKYTQALIKEHFKTRTCLNFHYEGNNTHFNLSLSCLLDH